MQVWDREIIINGTYIFIFRFIELSYYCYYLGICGCVCVCVCVYVCVCVWRDLLDLGDSLSYACTCEWSMLTIFMAVISLGK